MNCLRKKVIFVKKLKNITKSIVKIKKIIYTNIVIAIKWACSSAG